MAYFESREPRRRDVQPVRRQRRRMPLAHRLMLFGVLTSGLGLGILGVAVGALGTAPHAAVSAAPSLTSITPQDTQGGPWVP